LVGFWWVFFLVVEGKTQRGREILSKSTSTETIAGKWNLVLEGAEGGKVRVTGIGAGLKKEEAYPCL